MFDILPINYDKPGRHVLIILIRVGMSKMAFWMGQSDQKVQELLTYVYFLDETVLEYLSYTRQIGI